MHHLIYTFFGHLSVWNNCSKFRHFRTCVTDFKEEGIFAPPPSPNIPEQPQKSPFWIRLKFAPPTLFMRYTLVFGFPYILKTKTRKWFSIPFPSLTASYSLCLSFCHYPFLLLIKTAVNIYLVFFSIHHCSYLKNDWNKTYQLQSIANKQ